MWHHGVTFVALYMGFLVFQTYWGIATIRDNRWGTRDAVVDGSDIDAAAVRVLGAETRADFAVTHDIAGAPIRARRLDDLLPGGMAPAVASVP